MAGAQSSIVRKIANSDRCKETLGNGPDSAPVRSNDSWRPSVAGGSIFATYPCAAPAFTVDKPSPVLASHLAFLAERRKKRPPRALTTDRKLQTLVADLASARIAAGLTQEDVAARMWTTRSVVSRLESGVHTRPTLTTLERYAVAVGATIEVRVRIKR